MPILQDLMKVMRGFFLQFVCAGCRLNLITGTDEIRRLIIAPSMPQPVRVFRQDVAVVREGAGP